MINYYIQNMRHVTAALVDFNSEQKACALYSIAGPEQHDKGVYITTIYSMF